MGMSKKGKKAAGKKTKPGKPLISACMIVKDEEEMLPRCLASIKDQVDEIVVVDTGSTDSTVEIAESFGAKVYHHPWENDFSKHRNQSISYATGEWIFIIDADEEFIPSASRSLRQELAIAMKEGVDALMLRVENSISEGTEAICSDSLRIFQNNGVIRYEGIVHNNLVGCTHVGTSLGSIIHYGYDRGSEMARKKFERTATLLRKQIAKNPDNPLPHMYLACSHASLDRHREALVEALVSIDLVEGMDIKEIIYLRAYYTAIRSLILEKNFDDALKYCRKSEARFGEQVDTLAALTMIHFETANWEAVLDAGGRYLRALDQYRNRKNEPSLVSVFTFKDEWKILGFMGMAQVGLRRIMAAEETFSRALEISPKPEAVYRQAGLALLTGGHLDQARFYLEKSKSFSAGPKDPAVIEALFKIALFTKGHTLRKQSIMDALSLPGDTAAWLLNLTDYALSRGDGECAVMLLVRVVAADDANVKARLKLSQIFVFQGLIEKAVSQCDAILRLLGLPRDKTLNSLKEMADFFVNISSTLQEKGEPAEAALAMAVANQLTFPSKRNGDRDGSKRIAPGISLCMIVRDESEYLHRCLESVRPLVDEMVIVDTGSTDNTKEIAETFGAKVYSYPWNNDFSAARNFGLSKVTAEWTLIMDADEVIASHDLDRIKDMVRNGEAEAYRLILRNYVDNVYFANALPNPGDYAEGNGYPGYIPTSLIRLFRTDPEIHFAGCVHEILDAALADTGKKVAESEVPIHHYGKVLTSRVQNKMNLYKDLGINKMTGDPNDPAAYKTLADQCLELNLNEQALEVVENGLRLFPDFHELHFDKGLALERTGRSAEAAAAYRETIKRDNHHVGAFNNLASLLIRRNDPQEALKVLKNAPESCAKHPVICYTLGLAHSALGNHAEALRFFDKTLELSPSFKKVNTQKALVFLKKNEFEEASKCLEREIENKGDIVPALLTLGEIRLRLGDSQSAIHNFQRVLSFDPDNKTAGTYLQQISQGGSSQRSPSPSF